MKEVSQTDGPGGQREALPAETQTEEDLLASVLTAAIRSWEHAGKAAVSVC